MVRNRIKELVQVPAKELKPHPKNWRTHPPDQASALRALVEEVGIVGAPIVREYKGGYQILDGHLRAETLPDEIIPCINLGTMTDAEAEKILATFDPVGDMAGVDGEQLRRLVDGIQTDNADLQALLGRLLDDVVTAGAMEIEGEHTDEGGSTGQSAGGLYDAYTSLHLKLPNADFKAVTGVLDGIRAEEELDTRAAALVWLCGQFNPEAAPPKKTAKKKPTKKRSKG